ncbi:MAG: Rrf2 family transcriptional regulator [Synergistaceae bacterium]|nr:Rrf2 family transcriptional regulator [Synergistaceae bacterium]
MRLSTTARYGLRAMSDLCMSLEKTNVPVSVSDIATRQNIPVNYLEQLFGKLKRGGLLESVRGAQGGYLLARPAEKISIADILNALGEPFIFGSCQTDKGCENAVTCPTFNLWRRVKGSVDEILESTTLKDIAAEKNSLLENLETFIDPERKEIRNKALKIKKED